MTIDVANKIKEKLLRGDKYFNVILRDNGVLVDNLDKEPFLEWKVFEKAIELLEYNGATALKGDSMFRRITPIANILIWSGICENGRGKLILK